MSSKKTKTNQPKQTNKQNQPKPKQQQQPNKIKICEKKIIHPVAKNDLRANPDYGRLQIQAAV